jgi:hypothetical protein
VTRLEATGNDESLSTVKRNKAKAELAQMKQEDPLPTPKLRTGQEVRVVVLPAPLLIRHRLP